MIVNQRSDGWEVIYHRAHALLAAELASHWQHEYRPERWIETLTAIAEHDDEERIWDGTSHLTEVGMPLDFTNSLDGMSIEKSRWNLTQAEQQSRWTVLMVSRHKHFLLEGKRGEDPDTDQFLDEQIKQRREWLAGIGKTEEELERAYALMGWADRLSLILCCREIPAGERELEICDGPDGEKHFIKQCEDGTLQLTPWCYTSDEFVVSLETRKVKQASFKDEAEFEAALTAAPIEMEEWRFKK